MKSSLEKKVATTIPVNNASGFWVELKKVPEAVVVVLLWMAIVELVVVSQ